MIDIHEYRKANRLCVACGEDAAAGLTKCWRCYQIDVVRARVKYEGTTKSEKRGRGVIYGAVANKKG